MLIFLYFENFVFFGIFFESLENMCHTTRAVGQTLKDKKKVFLVILKMSVTRCGRSDTHNKAKKNIFRFLNFSIFYSFL